MKTLHCSITPKCKGDSYFIVIRFDLPNAQLLVDICDEFDLSLVEFVGNAFTNFLDALNHCCDEVSEA